MLRPSMHSLKHIAIVCVNDITDPLFGIPSELEVMRTKNIIETVTIIITVQADSDADFYQGDDWGRLDEVLTTPGWFSLKRVTLVIEIQCYDMGVFELPAETASRKLHLTQFPRLSLSNSVSFDLKVY